VAAQCLLLHHVAARHRDRSRCRQSAAHVRSRRTMRSRPSAHMTWLSTGLAAVLLCGGRSGAGQRGGVRGGHLGAAARARRGRCGGRRGGRRGAGGRGRAPGCGRRPGGRGGAGGAAHADVPRHPGGEHLQPHARHGRLPGAPAPGRTHPSILVARAVRSWVLTRPPARSTRARAHACACRRLRPSSGQRLMRPPLGPTWRPAPARAAGPARKSRSSPARCGV
jgi:hypothetical protein